MNTIAEQVPDRRHAVLIVDGANDKLNQPKVMSLKLSPYSPELNPMEQV